MRVTGVRVYPVKSMAGISVDAATVEPWGLAGDRRWAVVDEAGFSLTARQVRALLGFRAEPLGAGAVRIVDSERASLIVEPPIDAAPIAVSHSRQGTALPAPRDVNEWLSKRLGRRAILVWQPDPTARPISEQRGGLPGDSLSLADAGPLLLVSGASLAQLNRWIKEDFGPYEPLNVTRFRPNVIVDGVEPFAEDAWASVGIGEVSFRTTMQCDRCVMTTIDPESLAGGKEPIRTLARHRKSDGKVWFGIRLAPASSGTIRVTDAVRAYWSRPTSTD
jgi:uncharacterized protein YcbX